MTLSNTHLTPEEVAKWVAHQRVQLEAGTFDARTLTTTTMMGIKIASPLTLCENYSSNWRTDWTIDTFLKALE